MQLSATLQGVIYQRLIPRVDGGMVGAYEIMVATNAKVLSGFAVAISLVMISRTFIFSSFLVSFHWIAFSL